jgi:hypothetical protein
LEDSTLGRDIMKAPKGTTIPAVGMGVDLVSNDPWRDKTLSDYRQDPNYRANRYSQPIPQADQGFETD